MPDELERIKARSLEWFCALKPQNEYHVWMVEEIAVITIGIERSERIERRVRDKIMLRALLTWDDDRRLEAEALGGMLAKRPSETVEALRRTPQGCDWLLTRWALLARAADLNQTWTDEQKALAYNMLATPSEFRDLNQLSETLDAEGRVIQSAGNLAEVARREIAALQARKEVVNELDEVERTLAQNDLSVESDPELRRHRRYESALHRRLQWCHSQIKNPSPFKGPAPGLRPNRYYKPEPKTEAEILAENHPTNSIQPPFCLEPDEYPEPGQNADIPAILQARKVKRLHKAEARREAKRRKLEKMRA
jgi:hypothetical protein